MNKIITRIARWYERFFGLISYLRSPLLLFLRLYWGWQLAQSGWGKLHNLGQVTEFFTSLGLPMPAQTALAISCLEFFGGILFAAGLFSRMISLVLTINMFMAYITADKEAFFSFIANPDKFTGAAPWNFLVSALLVFIFGPGKLCLDTLLRKLAHLPAPEDASKTT